MRSLRSKGAALKYSWLCYRRESLWFPAAFLALFVVILAILPNPGLRYGIARAYLGFIVPLIGGILAAYSILDDPALELRFATPERPEATLAARLGLILLVEAVCAAGFQLFARALGVDLSPLGGFLSVQAVWLVPTLALISLGCAGSLAGAQSVTGAFLVGGVWLVQLLMKSWFVANARELYLFLGVFSPDSPALVANRFVLFAGSLGLLGLSTVLLRRPERLL